MNCTVSVSTRTTRSPYPVLHSRLLSRDRRPTILLPTTSLRSVFLMADYTDREHYIPLRRQELLDLLCQLKGITAEQQTQWRVISKLLASLFHFEFTYQNSTIIGLFCQFS